MPVIVVLSVVAAGAFSALAADGLSRLWVLPVSFIVCLPVFFLLYWLVLWLACFFIPVNREYEKPSRFYLAALNSAYWLLITTARVKLRVTGLEKLPKNRRFLFVSNHLSRFDNMIECVVMRKTPMAFITKPSNYKIPIGRHLMSRGGSVKIDRDSPRNAARSISRAAELIRSDAVSIGVFPEGHRGTGYDLQEFRAGCFKTALKADCPIVAATICGTEKISRNFPFRRTRVYFDIIDVIEPDGKKTAELSERLKAIMQNNLNKYKEC